MIKIMNTEKTWTLIYIPNLKLYLAKNMVSETDII